MLDTLELCAHCLDYRFCSLYTVEVAHSYPEG